MRQRTSCALRLGAAPLATVGGAAAALAGIGFAGVGLWARREVTRTLRQERIVGFADGEPDAPVASGAAARSVAEVIRRNTLAATGGRTYGETPAYVDPEGRPTADEALALKDERTGGPLENPDHALWIQSTTLQTALMQAYVSARLAELTVALGLAFVAVGAGLVAAGVARR